VKVDTVRVDLDGGSVDWVAIALPMKSAVASHFHSTAADQLCAADDSSAQLYVWHCALLI
jgi:hypothetical protein